MDRTIFDWLIHLLVAHRPQHAGALLVAVTWLWPLIALPGQAQPQNEPPPGLAPPPDSGTSTSHPEGRDAAQTPEYPASDDSEGIARSFLFKELVLSGLYSFDGVMMLPMDDFTEDHFEISPRPPGNYVGLEYVRTFSSASFANRVSRV